MHELVPLQLDPGSGVPMYRQIVDQIGALIASGQLTRGTQLPSVRELASAGLVSLITIRRAYADLEAAGLVECRQGQGTFVADDVETASRRHVRREAERALQDAVTKARQLGLPDHDIRTAVMRMLDAGDRPGPK